MPGSLSNPWQLAQFVRNCVLCGVTGGAPIHARCPRPGLANAIKVFTG